MLGSDFVLSKVPNDVKRDAQDDDGDGGVDAVDEAVVVVPFGECAVEGNGEFGQSLDDCLNRWPFTDSPLQNGTCQTI